jgi:hypothetical protein
VVVRDPLFHQFREGRPEQILLLRRQRNRLQKPSMLRGRP